MPSKKNSMVTMVTDEFLENRIILQKSVATIGFIWFFWFQKCILLYNFVQVFLVMRSIRSHISLFRLGFTPTLRCCTKYIKDGNISQWISNFIDNGTQQEKWQLKFNVVKYGVMHFGRQNVPDNYNMRDGRLRTNLEVREEEKDLGVTFDPTLKLSNHVEAALGKQSK